MQFSALQAPLFGFPRTDGLQVLHMDRLHVDGKGLLPYILKQVNSRVKGTQRQAINDCIAATRKQSLIPNILASGLSAIKGRLTASDIVALAKAVVVPLAAHHKDLASALAGWPVITVHTCHVS